MKKTIQRIVFISLGLAFMGLNGCKDDDGDDPQTAPVVPTSNFCYNFTNLAMPYDSIQGGTILTTTNNDGFYEVDLGFSFNLCEQSFSTLFIQSDFLTTTFTYEINSQGTDLRKYYILAHGDLDFEQKFDNNTFEIVSKIITTTTGSTGNKVTTIEFREFEYDDFQGSEEYTVNYKIIFSESDNSVSYHYGPNDLTVDFSQDVFNQFAIGLYSTNELDGLFLKGNPLSPTTVFNGFNSELTTWPLENTFYKFIKK